MEDNGDVWLGVRMALAATVSALVVAVLTIVVGRAFMVEPPPPEQARGTSLTLVSR